MKLQDDPEDEISFSEWVVHSEKDGTWREEESEADEFEREYVERDENERGER